MIFLYISIVMMTIGVIFIIWSTLSFLYTKIDDKPKVTKSKITDIPTKADIAQYNAQIDQQMVIYHHKVKQHIIDILDIAYKDYVNRRIEKGMYINGSFILNVGDYELTRDEIYAIRDKPIKHDIYEVEYRYDSCFFKQPFLVVTVNN